MRKAGDLWAWCAGGSATPTLCVGARSALRAGVVWSRRGAGCYPILFAATFAYPSRGRGGGGHFVSTWAFFWRLLPRQSSLYGMQTTQVAGVLERRFIPSLAVCSLKCSSVSGVHAQRRNITLYGYAWRTYLPCLSTAILPSAPPHLLLCS